MGIFDFGRRSSLESIALIAMAGRKDSPFDSPRWGDSKNGLTIATDRDEVMTYSGQLPWVSVAVDCIVRDIVSQEFYFTNLDGEIIDMRRVPDQVRVPFEIGYRGLSFVDQMKFIVPNRLLTGNSYLWRVQGTAFGASRGFEDSFIPLPPHTVRICLSPNKLGIEYYEVQLPDAVYKVLPEDMIHFRQSPVLNPFIGVGNITKMRILAEGDIAASEYINSFLVDSQKMPLSIVLEEGTRESADMQRVQDMLKAKYSRRMGYLNGEGISIFQSSLLQKDMDFMAIRNSDRQTTLSVFGVPPVVAGIPDDSNRATSGNQFAGYYKSTVNPILRELADDFTRQHVWKYDRNLKFQFRLHADGDVDNVSKLLQNGIITPNRAAELMGEEFDINDGTRNTYYFPATYLPLGYGPPEPEATPAEPEKGLSDPRNVKLIVDRHIKTSTRNKHFQGKYISASLKARNQVEERYVGKLTDYFKKSEARVMEKLRAFAAKSAKDVVFNLTLDELFDLSEEKEALADEIRPLHTSGVQKGINDINILTGRRVNLNLSNPFVKAAISRLGTKIVGEVPETTLKEVRRIVTKAVNESWNINQLQDAIQGKFDQFQGYRARMIARTESRAAWDAGAQVAYQEIGVKTVDVVGCTQLEPDSDCGRKDIPLQLIPALKFHPRHIGCLAPAEEI